MVDKEKEMPKIEVIKPKVVKKITATPEQIASRKRAHELKVAKFLAGGKY